MSLTEQQVQDLVSGPKTMAASLRECYDTPGYKLLMDQYHRELRRAELNVIEGVRSGANESEIKYRQGFLDCLTRIIEVHDELLEALEQGRIPWLPGRNSQ